MNRKERNKALPVELEKQLQQIKDVRQRSDFRKQFKNDLAVIKLCEEWIKEAEEPIVPPENPLFLKDQTYYEELKQSRLERVPMHLETIERMKRRIFRYKKQLEELISNA